MSNEPTRATFEKDNLQTVRALGNSWVVCKSKSHIGRIYYFNTLTGEAAWNLSDAEIEKAKKRTNILQSQSGAILESCPEPKDPPNDYVHVLKTDISEVPKRPTKNQFSKQKFHQSTCLNTHCVNCPVNTANIINTHPAPIAYNPNVWSIPPNHQIVIAPTNQAPTSLNVAYNNLEQHVSLQETSQVARGYHSFYRNRGNRNNRFSRGIKKYIPRRNNMNVHQRPEDLNWFNKFNSPSTSNDLREKLSAKSQNRRKSYENDVKIASNANTSPKQKIQIIKPTPEDLHPSDADDSWLKEHAYVEGTQLKLDVRNLKDIVMVDANMGCWYIVADSKTLLDHFNFINVIVSSDEKCQLMVSDDTMAELQMISRSDDTLLMSHAHLVLRLLSQQFTTGHAVLGKDQTNDSGSKNIIDFTKKLAEQNHNVVLVSNDIVTNAYNNGINIFTIENMKEIITNTPVLEKFKLQDLQELSRIKILVPNETSTSFETSKTTENNSVTKEVVYNKEINIVNTGKNTLKHMGVQTENHAEDKQTALSDTFHSDIAENKLNEEVDNVHNIDSDNKDINNTIKRRGIRLKRNTFQQSAISNESNVGMKQFKWRRRKKVSETSVEGKQLTTDVHDGCSDKAKQHPNFSGAVVEENLNSINENNKISNVDPCEDNFSETTSGSCFIQKSSNDKIVIEETSTSGIISNTPSFVESESSSSVKQNISSNINNCTFDQNLNKCVMFEVENSMMEDRLKMRSDEWLSRFVQVMEEILSQVLRLDPPFHHRSLPPPWTLHEAAECIKKKFHTDCDITDAASKLTDVLSRNSDSRGNINSPLKPSAFMEMYSYGVYLVDSLQAVITDFEDLQTAVDSLAKLLAEIQNPNEYGAYNDSFIEEFDIPTPSVSICVSDNNTEKESISTCNNKKEDIDQSEKRADNDGQKSTRKYNLRSSQGKSNEKTIQPQTFAFIRNIDVESTFFSSLKLKKNNVSLVSPEKRVEENEKSNCKDTIKNQTTEPEIIRHFSKNMEFEERIKNKQRVETVHDKHVDLEEGEYLEEGELLEEGEYLDTHHSKHLESEERLNSKQTDEYFDGYDYTDGGHEEGPEFEGEDDYYDDGYDYYHEENDYASETDIDQGNKENCVFDKYENRDFNIIIGKLINELQQAFKQVHTFCANICEELNASVSVNPARKGQIRERAEAAKVLLDNLIKSLNSIIFREDKENIHTILQGVGVVLDSSQAVHYRKTIAKGREQASILLESVNIVLEAVQ